MKAATYFQRVKKKYRLTSSGMPLYKVLSFADELAKINREEQREQDAKACARLFKIIFKSRL